MADARIFEDLKADHDLPFAGVALDAERCACVSHVGRRK